MRFRTTVELGGRTATGLPVPDEVVAALGSGRRPAVRVTISGHSYQTTVAPMGGRYFVPLSAEHRMAANVAAGDAVEVEIELDTEPRQVSVPADLVDALSTDPNARAFFDSLAPSHRKEWVRWIEEAKKPETRSARILRTVSALQRGERSH